MYHIKDDKRSIFTSEQIYEALIRLLEKEDIEEMTISRLVKKAEVGRSSFYRNFDSITDVLYWKCDISFNEVISGFLKQGNREDKNMLNYVLEYWMKRSEILEAISKIKRIDIIYECFMNNSKESLTGLLPSDNSMEYLLSARVGVLVSVLETWIKKGKKETSQELANIMSKCLNAK
jgi:AcrR family transcriptional regulator